MSLETMIASHLPHLTELRHGFHRIPELGYQEYKTAAAIRGELGRLGIAFVAGVEAAPTATIAWVGDTTKPCIALRSDIDALPIVEQTGLPYASIHEGNMHACGHDGHLTTLLGVAAVLKSIESDLKVCVKLIWQPAEEGGGGAERLVQAGVLDGRIGPKVTAIFGLHGWPGLAAGLVATKPGPLLAATDAFVAEYVGKGCHGAFPHLGRDPILAACDGVTNLQAFVSRELDPADAAVITVGLFRAGTAINIIPDSATFEGTARTLNDATRKQIKAAIERRLSGVAAAHDCELRFTWVEGYPATVNDPEMAAYVAQVAKETIGHDHYFPVAHSSMGGEDFAYYLEKVPGCFFLVGIQRDPAVKGPPLHSDRFDFNDASLAVGMRMFLEIVMRWQGEPKVRG